ncbi:hypothetical protein [Nonomuraea salmonea]|uniref:hypothetical protein n=1 Tax=Nonomuraea salmonea TaxID=46181 RepID=UPI002FED112B
MDQPGTGSRNVHEGADAATGRVRCTPPPAAELFEIVVLDTTGGDPHWHTIGWGVNRGTPTPSRSRTSPARCARTRRLGSGRTGTWWGCTAGSPDPPAVRA